MPVMDGFDAARAVRSFEAWIGRRPVPIVAMTAFSTAEDQRKCFECGMSDYIAKPFAQEQLQTVVYRYMRPS
jgi:CheY-like chemotaxis protein